MVRFVQNLVIRARNAIVHEFPVLVGIGIAAANSAADKSPKGYVVAAVVAALRTVVTPAIKSKELKQKPLDPALVAALEEAVKAALSGGTQTDAAPPAEAV